MIFKKPEKGIGWFRQTVSFRPKTLEYKRGAGSETANQWMCSDTLHALAIPAKKYCSRPDYRYTARRQPLAFVLDKNSSPCGEEGRKLIPVAAIADRSEGGGFKKGGRAWRRHSMIKRGNEQGCLVFGGRQRALPRPPTRDRPLILSRRCATLGYFFSPDNGATRSPPRNTNRTWILAESFCASSPLLASLDVVKKSRQAEIRSAVV